MPARTDIGGDATTVVVDGEPGPAVVVEPRLDITCLVWAADALAGDAHGGLFGRSTVWWAWWWRELAAGLVLALVALWIVVRRR